MGFFKRILGICRTPRPADAGCWQVSDGKLSVDLGRAAELAQKGGAIRLEGGDLARRVLVFRGEDGAYHAFENRCAHVGRRLDPVPGTDRVECCSVGRSSYDYQGARISGSAKGSVRVFEVQQVEGRLLITVT